MDKKLFDRCIRALPKKAKLLEVGYGNGYNIQYIKRMRPDIEFYTIDIIPKKKKDTIIPDYVKFYNMDVRDMKKFKANTFDCILCFHVLEHMSETMQAVSEMRRVVKKGGVIFAECPHLVSIFAPFGFNFYSTANHVRPHTKGSFRHLFRGFKIRYVGFDAPSQFQLRRMKLTFGRFVRKVLLTFGLYRTVVFIMAIK